VGFGITAMIGKVGGNTIDLGVRAVEPRVDAIEPRIDSIELVTTDVSVIMPNHIHTIIVMTTVDKCVR
jgi:hypothetical protein